MPSVTVVSGPNEGDYYVVGNRTMVVGRDEACPIQILDSKASRKHIQIRFDHEKRQHVALDMKSTNGTLCNGRQLLSEVPLRDGDELVIGESKIVFAAQEFPDKETALDHYRQRGERMRPTLGQG